VAQALRHLQRMGPRRRREPGEHRLTAWAGIAAIVVTVLAIFSAYLELNGTRDIEEAFVNAPPISAGAPLHASLQSWATGFSH
jgi:hypothetical protein